MMVHHMKLDNEPFNMIKDNRKTIELRLFDDKRQEVNTGDYIIFSRVDNPNIRIAVKVNGLLHFQNFEQLFEVVDIQKCGFAKDTSMSSATQAMQRYYSMKLIEEYGVLGIVLEIVDLDAVVRLEELEEEQTLERLFPDGMK